MAATHLKHRITRKGRRATPFLVELSIEGRKRLPPNSFVVWQLTPEEAEMMRKLPATIVKRIEGPPVWPPVKKKPAKMPAEPKKKPAKKKAKGE